MQIFAKAWNSGVSNTITLDVDPTDLISDVKDKIRAKLSINADLVLSTCGKILQDGWSLSFYSISKEANIDIFLRRSSSSSIFAYSSKIENIDDDDDNVEDEEEFYEVQNEEEEDDDNESNDENDEDESNDEEEETDDEDDSQKFHDDLVKSMAMKTWQEVELRTKIFKEKQNESLAISEEISKLQILHSNNAKEIKEELEETKLFNRISSASQEEAKRKKFLIDNKIKEFQQESSDLENQIRATTKKIIEKEETYKLHEQQKQIENNEIIKKLNLLERKKLMNDEVTEELSSTDFEFKKKSSIFNEGLVDFISKSIDEKKKNLECPVCFETSETPIFMCSSFHLVCKDCLAHPALYKCPECRIRYPQNPVRHRFAEKMDQEIKKLSMERKNILDAI